MSLKQNDTYNEYMNENKYPGKKLCAKCESFYHPEQYEMCFDCYAKQPARMTQYCKHESFSSDLTGDYCNLCDKKLTSKEVKS